MSMEVLVEEKEVAHLIQFAEEIADLQLKENKDFVKGFLKARKKREEILAANDFNEA